jgi:hypothetical protein
MDVPRRLERDPAMTARIYPSASSQLISGDIDWEGATLRAVLLSDSFVYDQAAVMLDEIDSGQIIATSIPLEGATLVGTTMDYVYSSENPFTWQQIFDDRLGTHVVVYEDTGDPAYSPLIAYWGPDTVLGTPLPLQGEDYFLYFPLEAGGYFRVIPGDLLGTISTIPLADSYSIGEVTGESVFLLFDLLIGRRLLARDRVCAPKSGLESCGTPVITRSSCA